MKKAIVIFVLISCAALFAVQKSAYDRSDPSLRKANADEGAAQVSSTLPHNDMLEICMLTGGYFTIGTIAGKDSPFDDHGAITYGHPYAVTSYPMLSIDGISQKLDDWLMPSNLIPRWGDNELFISALVENIQTDWKISLRDDQVDLCFSAVNHDETAHQLGAALVFDPALGQWGDGHLTMGSETIMQVRSFQGKSVYNEFTIAERIKSPVGMSVGLNCNTDTPDELIATNWQNILALEDASIQPVDVAELFDLCLKMIWQERTVQPNESINFHITLIYQQPEIPTPIYMRWDMPNALSIENGLLFPKKITTSVRSMNWVRSNQTGLVIRALYPSELSGTSETGQFNVNALQSTWMDLSVQAKEIFKDRVVPVTLQCFRGEELVDELERNVYIPAVPVSDEGLVVHVDSIFTTPETGLIFNVEKEETGQKVLGLSKENVLFYENDRSIRDFDFMKDTTGGATAVDIAFVLDVTGSMGGEIQQVSSNIIEFADSLTVRGVDYRLAMVTFLDKIENVYDFSSDVQTFKSNVDTQYAHGGGDGPENSLGALSKATQLSFRDDCKRIIIWITDADYHQSDNVTTLTIPDVTDQLLDKGIITFAIGSQNFKQQFYDPIVNATGGKYFDINGNFRDILLEISRVKSSFKYLLTFTPTDEQANYKLKIHYAGLGGQATFTLNGTSTTLEKPFLCYPNPFNPTVQIQVEPFGGQFGELEIFNLLGQRVRAFELQPHISNTIVWNADDEQGLDVCAGFYMVRLRTQSTDGSLSQHMQKILYIK